MLRVSLVAAALLVFHPHAGFAQSPPDWTLDIKLGKPLFVTTMTGERVEGVAGQVTAEGLVISTPVGIRTVGYKELRKVEKRDPVSNGVWIGTGAGFGLGLIAALTTDCEGDPCREERAAVPIGGALYGALIGWGLDAAVKGRATLFEANGPMTTVSLVPRRGGVSARVAITW